MTALQTQLPAIPRPEYPRPDWKRMDWLNLNGAWSFRFDHEPDFESNILVPFSWASPLSGIGKDEKGIGWYRRFVQWAPSSENARIFLRFGAVDYSCEVWVNGDSVGTHSGGYGSFEFDVTHSWLCDQENQIEIRVEDFDHSYQTRGKQGYGEIRGIWQPVWLEARPQNYVQHAKFFTRIDGTVDVAATIMAHQAGEAVLTFAFEDGGVHHSIDLALQEGKNDVQTSFTVAKPKLWSPDTPHLYEGHVSLLGAFGEDQIATYFGIREIASAPIGGRSYRWITLNGKPIFLNGALDQSYHRTGYFTYPTDEEMRHEIFLMKRLGLNFVRIHIKPEEPRKLYWADRLGILVMEDMPCFWGEPDQQARDAYENEVREVLERDFNHPSIISWVMFNETWGLKTKTADPVKSSYLPETQEWVRKMYRWAKQMDPTRLVEDNSPCNWDHVETDLNTWHFYKNGYAEVRKHISHVIENTFPGSSLNYIGGNTQTDAPLMNSECGNVWGIEGGAGDSDLAWHYRYMINEFRRHEKLCGFVFTEFRDVINEFNGYYRLDGSDKQFGYEWFVPGMSVADLHSLDFIVIDVPPCQTVNGGESVVIPLLRSCFTDQYIGGSLVVNWELWHDRLGTRITAERGSFAVDWDGYGVSELQPVTVRMPEEDAVAVLAVTLTDPSGKIVMRNFTTFDVRARGKLAVDGKTMQVPVTDFSDHGWPYQWNAIQQHKANGGPSGHFTYQIELPSVEEQENIYELEIFFEASAKRLLARNKEVGEYQRSDINFMHGADAKVEWNPNTYYMTDFDRHESRVQVLIDGERIESLVLPDDPADSRGVLSWHYQPVSTRLDEAGSYGYLCKVVVPSAVTARLNQNRKFTLQLRADEGGLALYGRNAGRYPIDLFILYR